MLEKKVVKQEEIRPLSVDNTSFSTQLSIIPVTLASAIVPLQQIPPREGKDVNYLIKEVVDL